jgi:SWI/SNF-related matrix-associated actin-dependent regulator of chromatin subfamily A-like protein 1
MVKLPIESKAAQLLRSYSGTNNYILYYQKVIKANPSYAVTKTLAKYVIDNYHLVPTIVNKWVDIHPYSANQLKEFFQKDKAPTKIFIHKVLSLKPRESIHIWGKMFEEETYYYSMFISPSAFIKKRPLHEIDWSKYKHRPPKTWQIPAIETLIQHPKFILADDMGLGKSTSAIIAAKEIDAKRILIICPATAKLTWKREISAYYDPKLVSVVDGNDWKYNQWVIINYDILRNFHHMPQRGVSLSDLPMTAIQISHFDLVIIDEAHKLKDATSQRSKIVNNFIYEIPNRWLLTGTPMPNHPIDYFNLLQICESPLADNWMTFVKKYCNAKQFKNRTTKKKYWVVNGHSNLGELHNYTKDIILRRMKTELPDLPDKIIKPIYLPLASTVMYDQYMKEYVDWLAEMEENGEQPPVWEHLTHLMKMRQMLSLDKIDITVELANDIIEEDKKVVIFTCFTETLDYLMERFGNVAVKLDGTMSPYQRQQSIDAFQKNPKIKVFVGNIIAAGINITLTAGEVAIFNDLDWVPANHVQAEDRILRIGQKNNVNIFYPIFDETLDVYMFTALANKKNVINTVLGDKDANFDETMAKYVIEKLKYHGMPDTIDLFSGGST